MLIRILSCSCLLFLLACNNNTEQEVTTTAYEKMTVKYPATATVDHTDDYHGTAIADPYRWLEVDTAQDVEAWVKEQNAVTFGYLENIPFRKKIEERLTELLNYPRLSSPFRAGDYYFFYKNDGLQNQAVIYYQKGLDGEPEVFIDPNTWSEAGTTAISLVGFSEDDRYVAFTVADAGSDWRKIKVMEVATKKELDDELEWVKFSGAGWSGDGFFYSRYPAPEAGQELSGNNQYHSVYFHKLGTPQSEDELVFRDDDNPNNYHYGGVTEDGDYFVMYDAPGTDGFAAYYKDLKNDGDFVALFPGYKNKSSIVHNIGTRMLVLTDIDAPKYRLVEVDINNPGKENWKEIIPESENLLQSVSSGGGYLFANYLENATDRYYQMAYDGSNKKAIELPGTGSAGGLGGEEEDKVLFYTFTSFTYPPTIFKYDVKTGTSEPFYRAELKFNPEDYVETQVFYPSKDGTKVSMFLVHKKGLKMDGSNPTYLYGYGGFNVSLTPSFSASRLVLLENGGVFAMANLRGGGEYGEEWHKGGMLDKKQNVFDDFIAGAEYLISEGYTSKEKLAIAGGSNGGLLVGACMAQRPDLFAVAFPAVGVMDMLRYHKFTVGKGWIPEYGSSDDPEQFKNLLSYSPIHNLKEGVAYPATMVTTADHDDRVVPAHSFKFAAQLQKSHQGDNPVLIRIATDAGHGAGKPISKIIEEQADQWSFFFYNTDAPVIYIEG
ncbi:prolyl oligopeptidase family serine peptidase [Lewinella cohaerens]|uniref:prolyl oligopeptidase family serine peptidase n=1 Tax=Lewinella cohaerens TaxID=70995 RepID=UPI000366BC7D|nr:prolyl oligopeptidase family serine peptidase [Lewinella cohaerens]